MGNPTMGQGGDILYSSIRDTLTIEQRPTDLSATIPWAIVGKRNKMNSSTEIGFLGEGDACQAIFWPTPRV